MLTRRDAHWAWLIRFSRRWLDEAPDARQRMTEGPWALREFAEKIQAPASADGARLALLYLAHPDTFEVILTPKHKQMIVERFAEHIAYGTADRDRQLLEAMTALSRDLGDHFDWYQEPAVRQWLKEPRVWPKLLHWLERFRADPDFEKMERTYKLEVAAKLNVARELIRSGSEGWEDAVRRAFTDSENNLTAWQAHSTFLEWMDREVDPARRALEALWSTDEMPVNRLRDFFDLVPMNVLGPLGARLNLGSFLLMAEAPTLLPPAKISPFRKVWKLAGWGREPSALAPAAVYGRILLFLDELVRDAAGWDVPLRDRLDAQGAIWALAKRDENPGGWSQKDWDACVAWRESEGEDNEPQESDEPDISQAEDEDTIAVVPQIDHLEQAALDLHVDRSVVDDVVELLEDKRQVVLYGPPGTGKTFFALRLARALVEGDKKRIARVQFHPATSYEDFFEGLRPRVTGAGQVTYQRTEGPLADIAGKAASDPDRRYVLVIDEINRANLPKVFGELLFLLEYRNEPVQTLYRPTEPFQLSENLLLIGTMNTADRSVALIDAAMRRRFHFVPFFPHSGAMKDLLRRWLRSGGGRLEVADFLEAVNAELVGLVGEHLLIGPSHFMRTDLSDRALERIWTYNVFPLIEEQMWGNVEEIDRWRWESVRRRFAVMLGDTVGTEG